MSTPQVPGAVKENRDELAIGCWAEHEDGSMIYIEGVNETRVVYSLFDLRPQRPLEYRDSMPLKGFQDFYSWYPDDKVKDPDKIKWTWHDKTPFPWDRVIRDFDSGPRLTSAEEYRSAADAIAESLELRAEEIRETRGVGSTAGKIMRNMMHAVGIGSKDGD